jgi:hypothetical protein
VLKRLALRAGTGADVAMLTSRTDKGWPFGLGIGVVICASALLRGRNRARAAAGGLTLFALTGLAIALGAIPQGPLFGGGLAGVLVLGAAAVRMLPPRTAAITGAAGTLVIGVSETAGPNGLFDHRILWALGGLLPGPPRSRSASTSAISTSCTARRWRRHAARSASNWPGNCTTSSPTTSPAWSCRPRPLPSPDKTTPGRCCPRWTASRPPAPARYREAVVAAATSAPLSNPHCCRG